MIPTFLYDAILFTGSIIGIVACVVGIVAVAEIPAVALERPHLTQQEPPCGAIFLLGALRGRGGDMNSVRRR